MREQFELPSSEPATAITTPFAPRRLKNVDDGIDLKQLGRAIEETHVGLEQKKAALDRAYKRNNEMSNKKIELKKSKKSR